MVKQLKSLTYFLLSIALVFLVGCSSVPAKKELTFNALILDNQSRLELRNVRIEASKTGVFASCGVILIRTSCSTTFRAKLYQRNAVYISWLSRGNEKVIGPLYVRLPEKIRYDLPASIMVKFMSENDVSAEFIY